MPSYTFCVQHAADKCLSMLLPAFTRFQSISGSLSFVCHNKARNSSELTKKKLQNRQHGQTKNWQFSYVGVRNTQTEYCWWYSFATVLGCVRLQHVHFPTTHGWFVANWMGKKQQTSNGEGGPLELRQDGLADNTC